MEILSFKSPRGFRAWLAKNHGRSNGITLRIHKKGSGAISLTYSEALDLALCYGWIDGQKQPGDGGSWLQKFTPRRPNSGWSKNNTQRAQRLIEAGEMTSAGLKEVKAAKGDGRWKSAYDSFSKATIPDEFLQALAKAKKAKAFFETLNRTNLYSIAYRLQTAKTVETRNRRIKTIIAMLSRGEKFH
jgi:uncharacterized protein YdeI (YjbR/CyaY-like superfamily)